MVYCGLCDWVLIMAIKYVDNFEFWSTTSLGTLTSAYNGVSVTSGKLKIQGITAGALISNYFTTQDTYIVNMRVNVGTVGNGNSGTGVSTNSPFVILEEGGSGSSNVQAGLGIRSDAKLQFFRQNAAIGGVSPIAFVIDSGITYYDLEYKITINNSTGTIEARVNGEVQIGPTGSLDTQGTSNAYADSASVCCLNSGSFSAFSNQLIEHLIIMDGTGGAGNDFVGPVDVDLLPPTGDGFYTAWSFTGAPTRWQCVDELNPNEDTDYIFDATVGDKNTFTHGALPAGSTAVKAAAVWTRARRDDAVTRAFKVLLRNGGSDQLGSVESFVGDDYVWFLQAYEVSPFTSSAWTVSEVNATEFGVQVTT